MPFISKSLYALASLSTANSTETTCTNGTRLLKSNTHIQPLPTLKNQSLVCGNMNNSDPSTMLYYRLTPALSCGQSYSIQFTNMNQPQLNISNVTLNYNISDTTALPSAINNTQYWQNNNVTLHRLDNVTWSIDLVTLDTSKQFLYFAGEFIYTINGTNGTNTTCHTQGINTSG